jgi:hypothetical protein
VTHTPGTPGPWTAWKSREGESRNRRVHIVGTESGLSQICEMWGGDEEDEANARLIAAAPDLLAALKDVAEQIAAYDYLHGENSCAIDDAPALAAIRDLYPCYDPTSNIYPATKAKGLEEN